MPALGAFTFVLHSHLPYARLAGRWPHGEEWIHEAASETYIPLLNALYDLRERGIKFKLTIGITPVLAEQLADADICDHFDEFLEDKIARAKRDVLRFRGDLWEQQQSEAQTKRIITPSAGPTTPDAKQATQAAAGVPREEANDPDLPPVDRAGASESLAESDILPEKPWWVGDKHLEYLAGFYQHYYENIKESFDSRYQRDIIGAFRQLQDEGYIEIITCAATHGYLPLIGTDSAIRAQLRTGVESYERLFGRKPRAIWLPECAYRPAYYEENGTLRPGIEQLLSEVGLKLFFSETHLVEGGAPVGVAAGEAIGPYGSIIRNYVVPMRSVPYPDKPTSTFYPYYVADTTEGGLEHSGVSIIARNNETGQRVWSADWGYPGDFDYREFHRKDSESGLQYWRVSGAKVDLGNKDFYHPDWAENKVTMHANDFVGVVERILQARHATGQPYGLISSNYDTELFGHWWFEGVAWLKEVLEQLANSPIVDLVTASEHLENHPPKEVLNVPEGSWGTGGTHFTWNNAETEWIWPRLHAAERRFQALANQHADAYDSDELLRGVMNQAARELLLAESSDWPFLVTTGQARDYAIQRFNQHLERFETLVSSIEAHQPDGGLAADYWEKDRLFPEIDYRWWCG